MSEEMTPLIKLTEDQVGCLCCPICFEPYGTEARHPNSPSVLGCGHSMCVSCLDRMGKKMKNLRCPKCAFKIIFVPPTNYALCEVVSLLHNEIRDAHGDDVRCGKCREGGFTSNWQNIPIASAFKRKLRLSRLFDRIRTRIL